MQSIKLMIGKFPRPSWLTKRRFTVGSVAILCVITAIIWALIGGTHKTDGNTPLFSVARGPLTISVSESGTVMSREQVVVKNEVEGMTTILWLVPEGTEVQKGDLLAELDSSKLIDSKARQQLAVLSAEAAYVKARENLEVTKSQSNSDIAKAELTYKFAELDLLKYQDGEYPQEVQQAQSQITLADEVLQRAQDKKKWSSRLHEEKYISLMEYQADELAFNRAQIELELAEGKLKLLQEYTHNRKIEQLRSDIEQAKMALDRTKLKASSDITQAQADLVARESEFERQKDLLQKMNTQIEKCKLVAPVAGKVVYATTGQSPWRGRGPLDEGREVRELEDLFFLPTATAMKVEVKIHESSLTKLRKGQPALITADAIPGKTYNGWVERISFVADTSMSFLNPDLKVYNTEVYIDGDASDLRPGMSSRAEIIVAQYEDATYVPVSAVVRIADQPTVYVKEGSKISPRPVEIGLDNNRMIVIEKGLKPGQQVLLAPPLTESILEKITKLPQAPQPSTSADTPTSPGKTTDAAASPADQPPVAETPAQQSKEGPDGDQGLPQIDPEQIRNMTPEQRKGAFEKLTPEQKEKLRQMMHPPGRSDSPGQPSQGRQQTRGPTEIQQ